MSATTGSGLLIEAQIDEHERALSRIRAMRPQLEAVGAALCAVFARGGRLYTFGNGGSAADAQHLAAEMIGHFRRDRRPLPAVALSTDPSVVTCIGNDHSFADVFARQVEALVTPEDMVIAFTTSGRSANVVRGLTTARRLGATTVLCGAGDGGPCAAQAVHLLLSDATATARVQEVHVVLLHLISEIVDRWAWSLDRTPHDAGEVTGTRATGAHP